MQKLYAFSFAAGILIAAAILSISYATFTGAVTIPQGPAVFETSLQSRISSTDTSMTLVANSVRGGSSLSGYNCFTIDEGRTDAEYVCGTVSGTAVTSLERGIDPLTGTTTNASLKFPHRVGANVKVTDFPLIQRLRNLANAIEYFPTLLQYATTATLCNVSSSNYTICDKAYIDSTANAGASDANDTTKGISERATAAEAGAGTALGGSGAALFLGANIATSTCQATGFSVLISSSTTGKLNANCLNTAYPYAWTALQSFTSASTSHATTSISFGLGAFPMLVPKNSTIASSSVLAVSGTSPYQLSFVDQMNKVLLINTNIGGATALTATSTYYTYTLPAGTLSGTHKVLKVSAMWAGSGRSSNCRYDAQFGNGSASSTLFYALTDSINSLGRMESTIYAPTATSQKIVTTYTGGNDVGLVPSGGFLAAGYVNGTYTNANQLYLSFRGSSASGATCTFVGASVEVLTQ